MVIDFRDMANIKFVVRGTEQDTPSTIYVTSRFGRNEKLMYAMPLKVAPVFWDAERQRVKNSKYCEDRDEVNAALNSIEGILKKFIDDAARDGRPITKESLRQRLDTHFKKQGTDGDSFHSFFDYYTSLCDTRVNSQRGGQTISVSTKLGYERAHHFIREYEKANKTHLDFENIDQDFYEGFVGYLQGLNKSTNTIGTMIAYIKSVLGAAYKRGLTANIKFKAFHRFSEEGDNIALTEDELKQIAAHDFTGNKRLERVRDVFLLGCYTGLRFSDVTRLQGENVGERMIEIRQKKTDNPVIIPIHPEFRRIWDKYGGQLPKVSSIQRFNEKIKQVCKECGLTEPVLKSITRGGKRITASHEKWELVSSHTARRSFATNLYRSGFPSISIMQITGHKSETAFLKYIKVSRAEHAEMLARHWAK